MIVNVSREQICGLLSNQFKKKVTDFVIINHEPPVIGRACRIAIISPLDNGLRIGNIKALRNISVMIGTPMTLAEGIWAMDNWQMWIDFVDEHNRLPFGGYGSGDSLGVLK